MEQQLTLRPCVQADKDSIVVPDDEPRSVLDTIRGFVNSTFKRSMEEIAGRTFTR